MRDKIFIVCLSPMQPTKIFSILFLQDFPFLFCFKILESYTWRGWTLGCIFLVNFCYIKNLKNSKLFFCSLLKVSPFHSGMEAYIFEHTILSWAHGVCCILYTVTQSDKHIQSLKSDDNLHSNCISTAALSNEGRFPITWTAKHKCKWISSVTHKRWSRPVSDSGQSLTQ